MVFVIKTCLPRVGHWIARRQSYCPLQRVLIDGNKKQLPPNGHFLRCSLGYQTMGKPHRQEDGCTAGHTRDKNEGLLGRSTTTSLNASTTNDDDIIFFLDSGHSNLLFTRFDTR